MNQLIPTSKNGSGDIVVNGRDLHTFLKVGKDFSNWFKDMSNYGFIEGEDFTPISAKSSGGRPRIEYVMTLDMAKEVSMIQRNDRGKLARQYFINIEKKYRQDQLDTSNLSPELKMFNEIFRSVANQELATKALDKKVDNIAEIVSLNSTEWRKTAQSLIHKMAKTEGGFGAYQQIQSAIYDETDSRAGSDLNRRLQNIRKNMAFEGVSASKINKMNKLDVLENDKRLKEIYMAIVKEFAINYKVWNGDY